jgi:hypothetical protein
MNILVKDNMALIDKEQLSLQSLTLNEPTDRALLVGEVSCHIQDIALGSIDNTQIRLDISNTSNKGWRINSGTHPITLGFHVFDKDGGLMFWDNGYRFRESLIVDSGQTAEIVINTSELGEVGTLNRGDQINFELLQEGNAWFSVNKLSKSCILKVK